MNIKILLLALLQIVVISSTISLIQSVHAYNLYEFDLSRSIIPINDIYQGGPPKDGIPALDFPKFVDTDKVTFLDPKERVLGIVLNGVIKAYPIKILNYHEIVNDVFAGELILVTYCPLCGTGMAFTVQNTSAKSFGVSGLLFNSDLLLYDRSTESLWSQILGQAISGPLLGQELSAIAITHTTWEDWQQQYPNTLVLSTDTGYWREYDSDPYINYRITNRLYFPVSYWDKRYHPKQLVIGLKLNGQFKVYPFVELAKSNGKIIDYFAGEELTIFFDSEHQTGKVHNSNDDEIPSVIAYWFAWMTFYPHSDVFIAD